MRSHFSLTQGLQRLIRNVVSQGIRRQLCRALWGSGPALGINKVGNVLPFSPPLSLVICAKWHKLWPSHELFAISLFRDESLYPARREIRWGALPQGAAKLGSHSLPLTGCVVLDRHLSCLIYKMNTIASSLLRERVVPDDLLRYMAPFPLNLWFQGAN